MWSEMSVLFHMSRFLACGVRFLNLTKFLSPTEFVVRDLALLQVVMKASDTPGLYKHVSEYSHPN